MFVHNLTIWNFVTVFLFEAGRHSRHEPHLDTCLDQQHVDTLIFLFSFCLTISWVSNSPYLSILLSQLSPLSCTLFYSIPTVGFTQFALLLFFVPPSLLYSLSLHCSVFLHALSLCSAGAEQSPWAIFDIPASTICHWQQGHSL